MTANQCPAGALCVNGANGLSLHPNVIDDACPVGKYCPAGATVAIDCPAGTYNPLIGRKALSDCLTTPAGYYTAAAASAYLTTPCAVGHYCLAGSTTAS